MENMENTEINFSDETSQEEDDIFEIEKRG